MTEEWRAVDGFPNYEVSNLGRVRIVRILKTHRTIKGYEQIGLYDEAGKQRQSRVHRLVCKAFNGAGGDGLHVAHLDGDKRNNHADNLAWATPKENEAHKRIHGTRYCGIAHHAKLTPDEVLEIYCVANAGPVSLTELGVRFGVDRRAIRDIRDGQTWTWLTKDAR